FRQPSGLSKLGFPRVYDASTSSTYSFEPGRAHNPLGMRFAQFLECIMILYPAGSQWTRCFEADLPASELAARLVGKHEFTRAMLFQP
ncbi:hypothetical protein, partial [Klebsiella pneumoniae]|uniref:hypothetical protein n=1 Tax=Klebsiella pneumoniae TaxID=573 RepID=UPI001952AB31